MTFRLLFNQSLTEQWLAQIEQASTKQAQHVVLLFWLHMSAEFCGLLPRTTDRSLLLSIYNSSPLAFF
ncbi:hypothetical protein VCRA2133E348_440014 [Vibrio crassostreae]|nr:hypothetical protein VCRA2133E348_440014 [Vibrio crassostreae]CAK3467250.1 hypothetical protein VCRA213O314_460014 [Vibrio crassostreae]